MAKVNCKKIQNPSDFIIKRRSRENNYRRQQYAVHCAPAAHKDKVKTHYSAGQLQKMAPEKLAKAINTKGFKLVLPSHRDRL